jgi:hypothetical protein
MPYDKQELAQLGKRAADLHIQHDMPLSDAVVKTVQDTPNLTEHHVTRILENANLITFEERFKGGDDKHVVFDLADPVAVSNKLDGESEAPEAIDDAYLSAPNYRQQGDPTIFDHEGEEKSSSYLDINSEHYLQHQLTTVRSAINHVAADLNRSDSSAEYEMGKLAHMVNRSAVAQNNASAPLELMSYAADDHYVFEKVAHTVVSSIPSSVNRGEYTRQSPNLSHPICTQYSVVEGHVKEASKLRRGLKRLNSQKQKLESQLQRRRY